MLRYKDTSKNQVGIYYLVFSLILKMDMNICICVHVYLYIYIIQIHKKL